MEDSNQAIKMVSQRTGLTTRVIQIGGKFGPAVDPERTGTNRRLYSDKQLNRLSLPRDIKKG